MRKLVPINVVTGYLGAGKTTVIKNLLNQIPNPEQVIWLKNEYGDVNVDALALRETHVQVSEIVNGCLCCVLVGRLGEAIKELLLKNPDRIIIETSGTAYPLPIVLELSRIPGVILDSVVTVVDVINFAGYKDTSIVGQMQYQAVDLAILNKWELTDLTLIEAAKDSILSLKPNAHIILSNQGTVSADLILGIGHNFDLAIGSESLHLHHPDQVDVFKVFLSNQYDLTLLTNNLLKLVNQDVIRIKGPIKLESGEFYFYNWVLGRATWSKIEPVPEQFLLVMHRSTNNTQALQHLVQSILNTPKN